MLLVYLAAPYTHDDPKVVARRMEVFSKVDAELNKRGVFTVSPLLKHFILQHAALPGDWDYWKNYSAELLSRCDKMIIIDMDGVKDSPGVYGEIKLCWDFKIPIEYLDPDEFLGGTNEN